MLSWVSINIDILPILNFLDREIIKWVNGGVSKKMWKNDQGKCIGKPILNFNAIIFRCKRGRVLVKKRDVLCFMCLFTVFCLCLLCLTSSRIEYFMKDLSENLLNFGDCCLIYINIQNELLLMRVL